MRKGDRREIEIKTESGFLHMEKKTENYLKLAINCNWGNCS